MIAVAVLVVVTAAIRGIWSPCGLSMISAINPFTERSRGNRYSLTAAWFVLGSVAGGVLLGGLGALGAVAAGFAPTAVLTVIAVVCCLVTLASDSGVAGFKLPLHPRQVNELWLGRYRRWIYASGFGAQIGTGFATYIMTAAVYLVPVLGAQTGSPRLALSYGVIFGLVRGLAVLLSSSANNPEKLMSLHRRIEALAPWSLRVAMTAQGVAALVFGFYAAGWIGAGVVAAVIAAGVVRARTVRQVPVPTHAAPAQRLVAAVASD